jgi:hypothetical protein
MRSTWSREKIGSTDERIFKIKSDRTMDTRQKKHLAPFNKSLTSLPRHYAKTSKATLAVSKTYLDLLQPLRLGEFNSHRIESKFTWNAGRVVACKHVSVGDLSPVTNEFTKTAEQKDLEKATHRNLEEGFCCQRAGESLVWEVGKLLDKHTDKSTHHVTSSEPQTEFQNTCQLVHKLVTSYLLKRFSLSYKKINIETYASMATRPFLISPSCIQRMSNAVERLNGSKSALPTRPTHGAGFGKNGTETELDMETVAHGAT